MTKSDKNKSISNKNRPKKDGTKKEKGAAKRPRRVDAVVFDPEARRQYLTGFSQRKQERRAFGLAMQKVKDRTARLEQRAELRSVTREQIVEAEERRRQRMEEEAKNKRISPARAATKQIQPKLPKDDLISNKKKAKNDLEQNRDSRNDADEENAETLVQMYEGEETQQQWGGLVVVTTSTNIPCSDDDDDDEDIEEDQESILIRKQQQQKKHLDAQQAYAGNVEKYLKDLKGNMPSKKNKAVNRHRGGKHGASNMKGVGSGSDLRVAQKLLARTSTTSKTKVGAKSSGGGKKRRTKR